MLGCTRRGLVTLVVALVGLILASTAFAHSTLIGTSPRADAVVQESPAEVVLEFNEPVETALGSIRVFNAEGERVDLEEIMRPSGPEVAVGLEDDLENGTYTVAWRAISADSDPINGAFVFHVGERGTGAFTLEEGIPRTTDVAFTIGRFFSFAFILLCAGGTAALVYPLRSADSRVHRRLLGILAACGAGLAVAALLNVVFQGAAAGGLALSDAFTWDVFSAIAETRYGTVALIQAGLGLALLAVALYARSRAGGARRTGILVAAVLGLALVFTPTFAGHASTSGNLSIVSDILHVFAASMWVGGLAFLVLGLWFALGERWPLATRAVPRFSTMAVGSVVLLLLGGTINAYLQVRTWSALWETTYGLLLLTKIGLVLPLLALGAYNNRYAVPRLRAGVAEPRERTRFLQAAGVELVIMTVIVGVTAVLVNEMQPRVAGHGGEGEAMMTAVDFGDFQAEISVDPGTVGPNEILIVIGQMDGEPVEPEAVSVSASLPEQDVGPLLYEAEPVKPGAEEEGEEGDAMTDAEGTRYMVEADLALAGEWELRVEIRLNEFDLLTETTMVTIEEER
jgi:copper transport protein